MQGVNGGGVGGAAGAASRGTGVGGGKECARHVKASATAIAAVNVGHIVHGVESLFNLHRIRVSCSNELGVVVHRGGFGNVRSRVRGEPGLEALLDISRMRANVRRNRGDGSLGSSNDRLSRKGA